VVEQDYAARRRLTATTTATAIAGRLPDWEECNSVAQLLHCYATWSEGLLRNVAVARVDFVASM